LRKHKSHLPRLDRFGRKMRATIVIFCLLTPASFAPRASAQKTDNKPTRKLVYKESPGYPVTLREAHIGGIVRLEIVISAKGSVDSVSPLGGNPVLVEAASAAVRKWKYAPADNETKTQVEFTFDPKH
jgi:TonB family protein